MKIEETKKNELHQLTNDILNNFDQLKTFEEKQYALECLWYTTLITLLKLDSSYTEEELYKDIHMAFSEIRSIH